MSGQGGRSIGELTDKQMLDLSRVHVSRCLPTANRNQRQEGNQHHITHLMLEREVSVLESDHHEEGRRRGGGFQFIL